MTSTAENEGRGQTVQHVTWEHFLGLPFPHEWVFRGVRDADWPLKTSLERYLMGDADEPPGQHTGEYQRRELLGLTYFQRRARHMLADYPDEDDRAEWLILMQHYGAPTRLLDWTFSPIVAAFFAFERFDNVEREPAIYALNKQQLVMWHRSHSPTQTRFKESIRKGALLSDPRTELPVDQWLDLDDITPNRQQQNRMLRRIMGMPRGRWGESQEVPLFLESNRPDQRVIAQSGCFTASLLLEPLRLDLTIHSPLIQKFVFDIEARRSAVNWLKRNGIDRTSLFPGLDGLGAATREAMDLPW